MKTKNTFLAVVYALFLVTVLFLAFPARAIEGGYKEGFYLQSDRGDFKLKFNFQAQPQYQFLSIKNQGKTSAFQIRRVRTSFAGNAFSEHLTYKIVFELVGGRSSNVTEGAAMGAPNLRDAYLNYDFENGIEIKTGQFKVYHSRESLNPASQLQFVDRSITDEVFGYERDLGLAVHGKVHNKLFDYALNVMNDGGNRNKFNTNDGMLVGGRLVVNVLGEHGDTMSDAKNSEKPQLAVAVASNINWLGVNNVKVYTTTGDVAYRYRGFSAIGEGHLFRSQMTNTTSYGFLGQMGYFLIPEHFEVAGRFAGVFPKATGAANGYETGVAFNYFFKGHNLKIQTDYNMLINSALVLGGQNLATNIVTTGIMGTPGAGGFVQNQKDHRFRTQLQIYF